MTRSWWSPAALMLAVTVAGEETLVATLKPETVAAWNRYADAVQARRARERADRTRFLVADFQPTGAAERRAAIGGEIVVKRLEGPASGADDVAVPSGRVHHWRGLVFIPGPSVTNLISQIEFSDPPAIQDDVIRSSVISRAPGAVRVFLRLQRTKIVTAVYNTEHDVRFELLTPSRAESTSVSTRIAELSRPGAPDESELPLGEDRGFLWRLNGYWRYEAAPGGVLAECESISLSRDVPMLLDVIAGRLINSTARESMERTLTALKQRYQRKKDET